MTQQNWLLTVVAIASLCSCAAGPNTFYRDREALSNVTLCRTWSEAYYGSDPSFALQARREIDRRGLDSRSCDSLIANQNSGIAALAGASMSAAGVALATRPTARPMPNGQLPNAAPGRGYQTRDSFGNIVNSRDSYQTKDAHGNIVNSRSNYETKDSFGNAVNSQDKFQTKDDFGNIVNTGE